MRLWLEALGRRIQQGLVNGPMFQPTVSVQHQQGSNDLNYWNEGEAS